MASELLIEKSDFDLYRPLPATFDWQSVVPLVLRVQRGWLRDALGMALYRDIHTTQTGNNATLISGGTYSLNGQTVDFYGIKPALVNYAYATLVKHNDFKLTISGNKKKRANQSEEAGQELTGHEYGSAMSEAQSYMEEVILYLRQNASTYPLWEGKGLQPLGGVRVARTENYDVYSEDDNAYYGRGSLGSNGRILNRY